MKTRSERFDEWWTEKVIVVFVTALFLVALLVATREERKKLLHDLAGGEPVGTKPPGVPGPPTGPIAGASGTATQPAK